MQEENSEFAQQMKLRFRDFIESDGGEDSMVKKIRELVEDGGARLVVNINDLRSFDASEGYDLARNLLAKPMECLPAFEAALKDYCSNIAKDSKSPLLEKYHVAVEGSFGANRMGPREIMSDTLTQLVCVEGIVTKCSLVRPKVVRTVHYCEATGKFQSNNYRDATSFEGPVTGSAYPKTDEEGNKLTTEFGLSQYKNHQKVFIQDMPERTAAGSMPRTIECIVENDLVDNCKPGDRVQMIGVYRALSGRAQGESSARFKTVVIANNIRRIGRDEHKRDVTPEDVSNIKQTLKRHKRDMFDLLARSVAPTIYGHDFIKKAVVLMLLGGCEKNLDNGTHIRGDINILMVGDPSTAKSQLLRAVMQIGNLVINTTGRGSSGVGLTAAVTTDKDSGEKRLEAGAMVLADRGIVCIDEFDKMSDQDRTAIHEVMEQQTVTIAKAGIHASLNARCSVIAASNPVYGQYNREMNPAQNIALPDSLLSRFDLLFIVLDKLDPRIDRAISEHVLRMHRYEGKENEESDSDQDEVAATPIYEKRDKLLQGAAAALRKGKKVKFLTSDFIKKFINYAKSKAMHTPPKLSDEAREAISQKYAELRGEDGIQTLPITARCLETIIRLASAHAKMRVSKEITVEDVDAVFQVLQFALTNDAAPVDGTEVANAVEAMNLENEDEVDGGDDEGIFAVRGRDGMESPKRRGKRKKPEDHSTPDRMVQPKDRKKAQPSRAGAGGLDSRSKKVKALASFLVAYWREHRVSNVEVEQFSQLAAKDPSLGFESAIEVKEGLQALVTADKIFMTNGKVYRL